jgi:hypothetical protein
MKSKLSRLTEKESSSEQSLEGVYHIVVDLNLSSDKKVTWADVEKKVAELGNVDDIYIERYSSKPVDSPFNIGDTIELIAEFNCDKTVYLDTHGNLVISDRPVTESVEKIGNFSICLPEGTTAEVNSKLDNGRVEVLFSGEMIHLDKLNRVAYLGILELPSEHLKSI